jgi:excisionase family DNA binding protein
MNVKKYMTIAEAMKVLGCSRSYINTLLSSGQIAFHHPTRGKILIETESFFDYIDKR